MRGYADVYAQAGVQLPASIRTTVERAPPVVYAMLTSGVGFRGVLMVLKELGVDLSAPFDVELFVQSGIRQVHTNAVSFALTFLWTSMRSSREHERLEILLEVVGPYVRVPFAVTEDEGRVITARYAGGAAAPPLMVRGGPVVAVADGLDALTVTLLDWANENPPRSKEGISTRLYARLRLLWKHGARVKSAFIPKLLTPAMMMSDDDVAEGDAEGVAEEGEGAPFGRQGLILYCAPECPDIDAFVPTAREAARVRAYAQLICRLVREGVLDAAVTRKGIGTGNLLRYVVRCGASEDRAPGRREDLIALLREMRQTLGFSLINSRVRRVADLGDMIDAVDVVIKEELEERRMALAAQKMLLAHYGLPRELSQTIADGAMTDPTLASGARKLYETLQQRSRSERVVVGAREGAEGATASMGDDTVLAEYGARAFF